MTVLEAAYQVLTEAGKPLHYRDVARLVRERGLCGAQPPSAKTVVGVLRRDIKKRGRESRFRRTSRGFYAVWAGPVPPPSDLTKTLRRLRKLVAELRERQERPTEAETKAWLVNPMLEALGWPVGDPSRVRLEYKANAQADPADYALMSQRKPLLLIEAKALNVTIAQPKWVKRACAKAHQAGVEWAALTNGDEYQTYYAQAPGDPRSHLVCAARVSDEEKEQDVLGTLGLLRREDLRLGSLRAVWGDRRVEDILAKLVGGPDKSLVTLIRKRSEKALTAKQIRESLGRASLEITFSTLVPPPPPPPGPELPPMGDVELPFLRAVKGRGAG